MNKCSNYVLSLNNPQFFTSASRVNPNTTRSLWKEIQHKHFIPILVVFHKACNGAGGMPAVHSDRKKI